MPQVMQSQAAIVMVVTNCASAAACLAMAVMLIITRYRRSDVICQFYAYPITMALGLLSCTFIMRVAFLFVRAALLTIVMDALTAMSLLIAVVYVRDLLNEIAELPNPHEVWRTNAELARIISESKEGDG